MQVSTIINGSASTSLTSGVIGNLNQANSPNTVDWQVTLSATGSVTLQGSLDGTNFYAIGSAVTTSSVLQTPRYPFMRAAITANTGTITVLIAQ